MPCPYLHSVLYLFAIAELDRHFRIDLVIKSLIFYPISRVVNIALTTVGVICLTSRIIIT
jgi:hypothetical protein